MNSEELLKIQYDYENNNIKEEELTEEEVNALIKLYNIQNKKLVDDIEIIKKRLKIVNDKYIELKDTINNK